MEKSKEQARSRSVCTNRNGERWDIPYSEYIDVMLAAKRYVQSARIFISADDLTGYVNDVFIKVQENSAYKAKLRSLPPLLRLSYLLRSVKARINDDFRRQRIHTSYGELTRPLLSDTALSSDSKPFEIDASLVLREILALFRDDKEALRLLSFLLNGNFVAANGNRRGRFALERISAQSGWPLHQVVNTLRKIKRRCRDWIEKNIDETDRDEMTFEEKLVTIISLEARRAQP